MLFKRRTSRPDGAEPERKREKALTAQEAAAAFEAEAPEVAFMKARQIYFETVALPTVEAARRFVIIVLLGLIVIVQTLAIVFFVNRAEVQPWVVKVDPERGSSTLETDLAKRWADYKPERAVLEREFTTVLRDMVTLNAAAVPLVQERHKRAFAFMRATAVDQFRDFMRREDPYNRMATIPGLVRNYETVTVSFRNDAQVVLIRYVTEERVGASAAPIRKIMFAQLTYVRVSDMPPEEMRANPLGIYVVSFDIQEER